jgi:hypothetical protein
MHYYNIIGIKGVGFKMAHKVESNYYDGGGDPRAAAARQVGGTHYKGKKCEVWDIIDEYGLDYYRGNALKYILRNKMDTYEDIQKAQHYIEKWLEVNKDIV